MAFWSRDPIGFNSDDVAAAERGDISPQRQEELAYAGLMARERLVEMPVPGMQDWMPWQRRQN